MPNPMTMLGLSWCLTLAALASTPTITPSEQPTLLQNPAFLEDALGHPPRGWLLPEPTRAAGFQASVLTDPDLPGGRCVQLALPGPGGLGFGNLMQTLDARPYRGQRIRLRGQLRLASKGSPESVGRMWLRVDRAGQRRGFFDDMAQRPVVAATWTPVTIVGDVAQDAEQIALGVLLADGGGSLRVGPLVLESLGATARPEPEGPKQLSRAERRNLRAFARALNYLRFFHPSDQAAMADWNQLASAGVRAVADATSPEALVRRLTGFFAPLAPTVRFLAPGQQPERLPVPAGAVYAVRWRHRGVGQANPQSTYASTRQYLPLAARRTRGWADPCVPAAFNLGHGLRIQMATVCFADASRFTLPHGAPPVTADRPGPTAGDPERALDRATRLGDVALAWGIFQHFYPYFNHAQTNWSQELTRALHSASQAADPDAFGTTLSKLVAALKDGHGDVYGGETYEAAFPAVGLVLVAGQPFVQFTGKTARTVPLGSRLLTLDGEPVEQRLAALRATLSAATPGLLHARLAKRLLVGPWGTTVELGYRTPDGALGQVRLPRDSTDSGFWKTAKPVLAELRPGVCYLNLDRLTEAQFADALPQLAKAKGVIFDLRGHPKLSPVFLQHLTAKPLLSPIWKVPVVTQPDGKGWHWSGSGRWRLAPKSPRIKGKIAFLTGGGAISYAESCLGIVEAYRLGEIVGTPTAGTNGQSNQFWLSSGFSIPWTGMQVLKHDGTTHHGIGILPTVPVEPTVPGLAQGQDEVLACALALITRP